MKNKKEIVKSEPPIIELGVVENPQSVVNNAVKVAKILKNVVDKSKKKSIIVVNNNEYLMFPAWQTLSQFYGFSAQTEWTKRLKTEEGKFVGYEAKAVLINLRTGQTYPGAEASCLVTEPNWIGKQEFTLKSMAQTRACSKTLANQFRWVATLAGFEGTPAEEMPPANEVDPIDSWPDTGERKPTPKQISWIHKKFKWNKISEEEFGIVVKPVDKLNFEEAKILLDFFFKKENKDAGLTEVLSLFNVEVDGENETTEGTEKGN